MRDHVEYTFEDHLLRIIGVEKTNVNDLNPEFQLLTEEQRAMGSLAWRANGTQRLVVKNRECLYQMKHASFSSPLPKSECGKRIREAS